MHEQEAAAGRVGSDCGVVEGHGDDCECLCTPSRFAARREPVPDQAGEQRDQLRSCASHPRAVSGLRAFEAPTGKGEAGSGVGATVALPFCGTYGRWTRLRAGAVNGLLFRRGRRAAGRLLSRVPTECRAWVCAARSCCCDAATLRGRCSMATSILSSWQACVCCKLWMRAGTMAPCALAGRGAATRSSIVRPSPRCGLSVPP